MAQAQGRRAQFKLALVISLLCMTSASAAVPDLQIGAAAKVVNSVYGVIELARQSEWLRAGMEVFQNETIVTAESSASEVIFKDTTQLSMGPTAQVKLDRFVFDPNPAASTIAISFISGAFRFPSGLLPKQNYSIHTPAATIGVRGTVFTVLITPNGSEYISVESGTIYVTCRNGVSVSVNAGQTTYIPSARGSPGQPAASPPNPAVARMDSLLR